MSKQQTANSKSTGQGKAKPTNRYQIDPLHSHINAAEDQQISIDIHQAKYAYEGEQTQEATHQRIVEGIYQHDTEATLYGRTCALEAMNKLLWVPGGRIFAGAGTKKVVTLINCYVDRTIEDSMVGIADALKEAMLTMQQGGGIGMDFSTLRPSGAWLQRTGSVASGPLPFMDMWDSMNTTIMSAGARRGAMMGTMSIEHPDIVSFITAKQKPGRLTSFNVSVLVTDAFMDAVQNDEDWFLGFEVPKADGDHIFTTERERDGGIYIWYAYEKWSARALWDLIIRNTYEYSEPGVIYIDKINEQNNLKYVEYISCTNPCGEQPLPPHGACNLGAVNLARMVSNPFSEIAVFNYDLLIKIVKIGVRFLDNVIDVTHYPIPEQEQEEVSKRRIGLGITGLANALAQLRVRYGSEHSLQITNKIMCTLKEAAYEASADLAAVRGPFKLYDAEQWGRDCSVVKSLPVRIRNKIKKHGIRNGVLLTIAPTGTTSIYVGNVSSGLEPVFLHESERKVRQDNGSTKTYKVYDYGYNLYKAHVHMSTMPIEHMSHALEQPFMVSHADLTVQDHIRMQAVCQRHIDASVSKTINCPEDMDFDAFKLMYLDAYNAGCKGCTTYRPSAIRGSVLSAPSEGAAASGDPAMVLSSNGIGAGGAGDGVVGANVHIHKRMRPDSLTGKTYKLTWPKDDAHYYITINDLDNAPYEMFISSASAKHGEWITALSLMISAIMQRHVAAGGEIDFIHEELSKVVSVDNYGWVDGSFYGSLVAYIGCTLKRHLDKCDISGDPTMIPDTATESTSGVSGVSDSGMSDSGVGEMCGKCNQRMVIFTEGCKRCLNCNDSSCA